jgi:pilus assembly protein Flp/PilA
MRLRSERGQGLIEYLIIVALMAVATIGIVRVLGQTVSAKFASATYALQGTRKAVRVESVDENLHQKKDLGDFMNGAGSGSGGNDF